MNALSVIHPYKYRGMWVFDDEDTDLVREPFVSGADEIIEHMVRDLPGAEQGFNLVFSGASFPGFQLELFRETYDHEGYWYYAPALGRKGWLCPALFKYFDAAPDRLYVQFLGCSSSRGT